MSKLEGQTKRRLTAQARVIKALAHPTRLFSVEELCRDERCGFEQGPALALLLAGPAVSLPNMLVISSVYILLLVVMATASGFFYGASPEVSIAGQVVVRGCRTESAVRKAIRVRMDDW